MHFHELEHLKFDCLCKYVCEKRYKKTGWTWALKRLCTGRRAGGVLSNVLFLFVKEWTNEKEAADLTSEIRFDFSRKKRKVSPTSPVETRSNPDNAPFFIPRTSNSICTAALPSHMGAGPHEYFRVYRGNYTAIIFIYVLIYVIS